MPQRPKQRPTLIKRFTQGDNYTVTQGSGEGNSIYDLRKNALGNSTWEEIITQSKIIDGYPQIASSTRSLKQFSSGGG